MGTEDMDVTAQAQGLSPAAASRSREVKTIAELAEERFVAWKRVEYLGASNVAGLSYDEQKKSAIAYAEAQAEAFRTEAALQAAIRYPSRLHPAAAAEAPGAEGVSKSEE